MEASLELHLEFVFRALMSVHKNDFSVSSTVYDQKRYFLLIGSGVTAIYTHFKYETFIEVF